jgi:hypothetical protein
MNDPARPTTRHERDRALDRLRSITTGTAVMATLASAGFGTLAAFTWSGTTTDAAEVDAGGAGATLSQIDDTPLANGSDLSRTSSGAGTAAATTPLQPTAAPITATKKKSKVTSGGSH